MEKSLEAECALHNFYEVDKNPHFANRAKQTSTGFYFNRKGQKHPKISGDNHSSKREELRKNLSEKRKGDKNPMYGMTGEKNPFFGRKHTKESKDKIGVLSKNRNSKNKWWVNPDGTTKFQQECPGVEWKRGRVL